MYKVSLFSHLSYSNWKFFKISPLKARHTLTIAHLFQEIGNENIVLNVRNMEGVSVQSALFVKLHFIRFNCQLHFLLSFKGIMLL